MEKEVKERLYRDLQCILMLLEDRDYESAEALILELSNRVEYDRV
jgi:hypothetical protein